MARVASGVIELKRGGLERIESQFCRQERLEDESFVLGRKGGRKRGKRVGSGMI